MENQDNMAAVNNMSGAQTTGATAEPAPIVDATVIDAAVMQAEEIKAEISAPEVQGAVDINSLDLGLNQNQPETPAEPPVAAMPTETLTPTPTETPAEAPVETAGFVDGDIPSDIENPEVQTTEAPAVAENVVAVAGSNAEEKARKKKLMMIGGIFVGALVLVFLITLLVTRFL